MDLWSGRWVQPVVHWLDHLGSPHRKQQPCLWPASLSTSPQWPPAGATRRYYVPGLPAPREPSKHHGYRPGHWTPHFKNQHIKACRYGQPKPVILDNRSQRQCELCQAELPQTARRVSKQPSQRAPIWVDVGWGLGLPPIAPPAARGFPNGLTGRYPPVRGTVVFPPLLLPQRPVAPPLFSSDVPHRHSVKTSLSNQCRQRKTIRGPCRRMTSIRCLIGTISDSGVTSPA
ncbi:hypothetical protein NHX12_019441 [Muraenolepis orangiensis]|uniref:Uncharacterized protein n=1 Tax=Muraenolepis orangiensis TaxID=630683 RepID=A0A9Q0ETU9_9TELE|nr:hypothetical protein NHX12_019441 [Muraenolepis orangiensis]